MNKKTYLEQLSTALRLRGLTDIDEIVEEYDQHFSMKQTDGYTEEEIAARLDTPTSIALQFEPASANRKSPAKGSKALRAVGLGFFDLLLGMVYVVLYAWVIVLGAFSLACLGAGLSLALGIRWNELIIPYMPFLGGLIFGISLLALSVLSFVVTIYLHLYLVQMCKAYFRWHKNTLSPQALPPRSLHPALSAKFKRRMRKIAMTSALIFGVTISAAIMILMAYAGFKPFWHEWNWFH